MDTNTAPIRINFYHDKKDNSLFATVSFDGKRTKIYIKETIEPDLWNRKNQRAIETIRNIDHNRLNSKLNEIENTIKKLFHQFIKDYERKPEPKELKYIFIKEYFEGLPQFTTKKKISLLETFDEYIEIKKLENTPAVSKRYLQAKNDLIQFGKKYKQQIQFENINMEFRNKYVSYLQNDLGLADSTTYRRVKYVKTILTYALNSNYIDKLNINLDLFNTKDRTGNKIALSENEVHELETIDLSGAKRLDEVRDRFLLGCYTGLRYSDFSRLNKNHIIDDKYIQIEQQKVKTPVTIPFTDKMRRVFLKYDFELPEPISEQKFNQYLKELGAKCDTLQRLQETTTYIGNRERKENVPRYSLMTTHTARRTFATIYSAKGIDLEVLRYATGHTTTTALKRYIKLDDKQKADILRNEIERASKPKLQKETPIIELRSAR